VIIAIAVSKMAATDRAPEAPLHKVLNVEAIGVLFFDPSGTLISAKPVDMVALMQLI
jgi:hypothetical protein